MQHNLKTVNSFLRQDRQIQTNFSNLISSDATIASVLLRILHIMDSLSYKVISIQLFHSFTLKITAHPSLDHMDSVHQDWIVPLFKDV